MERKIIYQKKREKLTLVSDKISCKQKDVQDRVGNMCHRRVCKKPTYVNWNCSKTFFHTLTQSSLTEDNIDNE